MVRLTLAGMLSRCLDMTEGIATRQHWMSVLARADAAALRTALEAAPPLPACPLLRGPEIGLAMLRGRAGGGGAAFNLGEASVTRCTLRSAAGAMGHATVLGRDPDHAELAARIDAALQSPALHDALMAAVVAPLAVAQAAARARDARRAAATKVDFFTLATMR